MELNTQKFKFSQKSVLFIERYFDMCTFHKLNQKSENCFANLTKNAFKMCIPYIFLCFSLFSFAFFYAFNFFSKYRVLKKCGAAIECPMRPIEVSK